MVRSARARAGRALGRPLRTGHLGCVSNDEDTGRRLTAELQVQELVERAAAIIRKRPAVDKPTPPIERKRRLEGGPLAGFQAQPAKAARAGLLDDVLQYPCANPLAAV